MDKGRPKSGPKHKTTNWVSSKEKNAPSTEGHWVRESYPVLKSQNGNFVLLFFILYGDFLFWIYNKKLSVFNNLL